MKKLLLISLFFSIQSCWVDLGNDEENSSLNTIHGTQRNTSDSSLDYDGDGRTNQIEVSEGTNQYIADIPIIDLKIGSDISIEADFLHIENNQDIHFTHQYSDTDFLKTNTPIVKTKVLKQVAESIVYGSSSILTINKHSSDYLKTPPKNNNTKLFDFDEFNDIYESSEFEHKYTNINLKGEIGINHESHFNQISDIRIGVYLNSSVQGKLTKVGDHYITGELPKGEKKKFKVELNSVPRSLISNDFIRNYKGFYVKVEDYKIDSLKTTYQQLISRIKSKTIRLDLITPYKAKAFYVATRSHNKFSNILNLLFKDDIEVSDNEVIRIENLRDSLNIPTNLGDLANENKAGKWFTYSSIPNEGVFSSTFSADDRIVLAYFTGKELSKVKKSQNQLFKSKLHNTSSDIKIKVGTFNKNSSLKMYFKRPFRYSKTLKTDTYEFKGIDGICNKNCARLEFLCQIDNIYTSNERKVLNEDSLELQEDFYLEINNKRHSFKELINQEAISLQTNDINTVLTLEKHELLDKDENNIRLIVPSKETNYEVGTKLRTSIKGGHHKFTPMCTNATLDIATTHANFKIHKDSLFIHEMLRGLRPDISNKLTIGNTDKVKTKYVFTLLSIGKNFFN